MSNLILAPCAKLSKMNLGELYEIASKLGEVEIGDVFHPKQVAIKLHEKYVGRDWVKVRQKDGTVEQNLAAAIERARQLIAFYKKEARYE